MGSDHHHFDLHKILHSKMNKIYFFQSVFTFVKSLIGIFIPVYLYSIGIDFSLILLFLAGISLTYIVFAPLTVKLISKFGFKISILLSIPLYMLQLVSLQFLELHMFFFHLVWFSYGLHMALFWPAFHSEIAVNGSQKHRSSQIGTLQLLTTLTAASAPFFGGFFLEFLDFHFLLLSSLILLILGLLPFFFSQDIKIKKLNFSYSKYIYFLKAPLKKNSKKAFFFEGIESLLIHSLWPIVLFVFLQNNFFALGSLLTIISTLSVVCIVYFKAKLDLKDKHLFLKKVSKYISFNWFLRYIMLVLSSGLLLFIEGVFKLVHSIFALSFVSLFYNNAKSWNYMDYILFRELFHHLAKLLLCFLLYILYLFVGFGPFFYYVLILFGIIAPIGLSYLDKE